MLFVRIAVPLLSKPVRKGEENSVVRIKSRRQGGIAQRTGPQKCPRCRLVSIRFIEIDRQLSPGHITWERQAASGQLPDNQLPAISSWSVASWTICSVLAAISLLDSAASLSDARANVRRLSRTFASGKKSMYSSISACLA